MEEEPGGFFCIWSPGTSLPVQTGNSDPSTSRTRKYSDKDPKRELHVNLPIKKNRPSLRYRLKQSAGLLLLPVLVLVMRLH